MFTPEGELPLEIDISIPKGQFVAIMGKSGAGKTTLLKSLAGITQPDSGTIRFENTTWLSTSEKQNLPPQKRNVGMVFQDYALFPNMTVQKNLEFVYKGNNLKDKTSQILELLNLGELANRFPQMLSGGQQQRVALGRALMTEPKLLLLDEPLSALDYEMRLKLQDEIRKIHTLFNLTTIMISHEPSEIYRMADLVIELEKGKIVQVGSPDKIFKKQEITGKLQLIGEIVELSKQDVVYIAKVFSENKLFKIIITQLEAEKLAIGDKVLVSSKAFNPIVQKI